MALNVVSNAGPLMAFSKLNILHVLAANFDRGEKDSIALALSKNALLLMDEERGRDVARQKKPICTRFIGYFS